MTLEIQPSPNSPWQEVMVREAAEGYISEVAQW